MYIVEPDNTVDETLRKIVNSKISVTSTQTARLSQFSFQYSKKKEAEVVKNLNK